MDIIEGLDLTGDLPEGFDFSLDDILAEYKTPAPSARAAVPEELYPSRPVRTEPETPEIDSGEFSSREDRQGDPFRLGEILDEFSSRAHPAAEEPVRSAPTAEVYEDEEGVKVYTPAHAVTETPPPASPLSGQKNSSPTMKFGAVTGLLNRKKKQAPKAAPVSDLEDDDLRTFEEAYSDVADADGVYAAYQEETPPVSDHDYLADFGLESDPTAGEDPPARRKKRAARREEDASADSAAAPLLSVLHAARESRVRDAEEPEDLGPEVSPQKATRHYGSHIELYRSRLHIAVVLCVILGWLSLGLPVAGSLKNTAVNAAMCLILLLTITLLGADIFTAGIRALFRKRADAQSLVAVSCIASAVDAGVIIATHGAQGYLPFCVVSGVSMCFAIYSAMLYCRGQRFNFRVLTLLRNPTSVSLKQEQPGDGGCISRTAGYPEEYIHTSEEEDLGETAYSIAAPFLLMAVPVLSLLAAILSKNYGSFLHILSALYAAAASFSALLAFPLPYFLVQRDLFRSGSSVAGWAGTRDLGTAESVVITDKDLFPEDTVSIESVRILEGVDPEVAVSYVSSVIAASGSCLAPVFTELVRKNNCVLRNVEEFKCHEAGGLTAMIDGAEVLVGSSTFIKLMGIHLPQKLSSKNSVFLAINSRLVGIITVSYKATVPVQQGLAALLQGKAEVIFATRDFNVTPVLVSQKFKLPSERLNFPTFAERFRMTDANQADPAPQCSAVLKRKTLFPFAALVTKARKLYSTVCLSVGFSLLSSIAGVILMFFLCCTGAFASASPGNLLLFMLLWIVPTVVFSIGMTK